MKQVTVRPGPDGHDMQRNWEVAWNNNVSAHIRKSAAKRKAREVANDGDELEIRTTDGQIQKRVTVQKASSSTSDGQEQSMFSFPESGGDYGQGTFETGVSDFF